MLGQALSRVSEKSDQNLTNIFLEASHEVDDAHVKNSLGKDEDELDRCLQTQQPGSIEAKEISQHLRLWRWAEQGTTNRGMPCREQAYKVLRVICLPDWLQVHGTSITKWHTVLLCVC